MLECVLNISEGRDGRVIGAVAAAGDRWLLDVHTDPDHHRSVLTLAGPSRSLEDAVRAVAQEAVRRIDLSGHAGAHPRLGAVDVVPFVPLGLRGPTAVDSQPFAAAIAARDRFAAWAGDVLGVPCFYYGPERSLPDVRRHAFSSLAPDAGPPAPHPTAGAMCVGARPVLVAYNLWLAPGTALGVARGVAAAVRNPAVRSLGIPVGERVQVSLNLVDPFAFGPADAYDAVASRVPVARAELVGLLPSAVLEVIPSRRWPQLDLSARRTIEARLGSG